MVKNLTSLGLKKEFCPFHSAIIQKTGHQSTVNLMKPVLLVSKMISFLVEGMARKSEMALKASWRNPSRSTCSK